MQIPIQNIYYLLCYAWNKLEEKDKVNVSTDDATELVDLFAKVLINATKILLKRGLDKSYVNYRNEIPAIKGKIAITETLQLNLLAKQRAICIYDEFSSNILTNQILVTTLRKLLKIKKLDKNLKQQIKKLLYMFPHISTIHIKLTHFKQIRLHRNNRFYDFILKVCQIIHENILPGEEVGTFLFADFTRDKRKMNRLFEEFIFQFYKIEQSKFKVKREQINWQFSSDNDQALSYLPIMRTDISLLTSTEKIIIDAKYYQETLSEYYGKKSIKSANLYQLFSYLINQEKLDLRTKSAKGILLYPTIDAEYDLEYSFQQHSILIRTVNLNEKWQVIAKRLQEIIE